MLTREGMEEMVAVERPDGIVGEFHAWLAGVVEREDSDLHVKVGAPPKVRRASGVLEPVDRTPLGPDEDSQIADAIVLPDRRERFDGAGEVDLAYSIPHVGRFRVNVFRQRGATSIVLRRLRFGGPTFEELDLPEVVRTLAEEPRGLVLVTGPAGSGKTTTLSAMIEHLNRTRQVHIVTIEDPIEVLFRHDHASIDQREHRKGGRADRRPRQNR